MVSVLLVSSQTVVAEGLRVMLEASANARLTATCDTLADAVHSVPRLTESVILLDVDSNWELSQLREACHMPGIRVCLYANSISPELFFQTSEAGLAGIISTQRSAHELIEDLCGIAEGQLYFDPKLTRFASPARAVRLTPREGKLIELLTQGLKNKEIAYTLGITEGTVKVYLSKLFQKVGAKDRFDLALSGLKNLGMGAPAEAALDHADAGASPMRTLITRMEPVRERRSDSASLAG